MREGFHPTRKIKVRQNEQIGRVTLCSVCFLYSKNLDVLPFVGNPSTQPRQPSITPLDNNAILFTPKTCSVEPRLSTKFGLVHVPKNHLM